MTKFRYKAANSNGQTVQDTIEALDRKDLMSKLRALSLSPLEIREEADGSQSKEISFLKKRFSGGRVTRKNITQFTSQLSALVNAKMNLAKALNSLKNQSVNEGMQAIISSLLDDVQRGKNLSEALEAYPAHFSSMYINMIKIGEVGGVLDQALERLVDMRTKDEQLIGQIKGALAYPCVMAAVMLGSIIVMLTFVIPKFSGVFSQMGGSLPFTTRVVLGTSDFLKTWWWLVIIVLGALVGLGYYLLKKDEYRLKFDRFKLELPIFGHILKAICISRFSLSMGALLSSGVSMMKALDATVSITGNFFIEKALRQIAQEVREGSSLSESLRRKDYIFPSLMIGMAGTGEDAGSLDEMLSNVGEFYRKESEAKINTLTTLLEPVMIVVMGGIVGFIVSAILLPIFNVSTSIH